MVKDNTIVGLNTLEVDLLINLLDEVVSNQKIPDIIDETVRQELFAELDIAKILTDLKNKLGKEKFEQLEPDLEDGVPFIIKFTDMEIFDLKNGDYGDIEPIIENIIHQLDNQIKEEES